MKSCEGQRIRRLLPGIETLQRGDDFNWRAVRESEGTGLVMARGDGGKSVFEEDNDCYSWVDLPRRIGERFG